MKTILLLAATMALAACSQDENAGDDAPEPETEREVLYWYDPMHPEQRFDEPGPSPFMDMDLVPRYADEAIAGQVRVTPGIQQAMNLRTAPVEQGRLWRLIDTVGHVDYDESRLHQLHPRVNGWIEEVFVDAVGETVEAGQPLFTLYSPELVNAQEEFLHTLQRGTPGAVRAARDKLRALDVQPEAIAELERTGVIQRALPWLARHDGVVTMLGLRQGMFVQPGNKMLELADLSEIWVHADVFDRHAEWLAVGQAAEVSSSYSPGRTVDTTISYIYPELDRTTRSVRVRLPIENPGRGLKPGMWTSVRIFAGPKDDVVMIPREALIRTGHSARVVLREDGERFRVRTVVPGMESGDWVEIREGLEPGEEVVVSGQFLVDSEASLRAGHDRLEGTGDD